MTITHGASAYRGRKPCRCDVCREASTIRVRQERQHRANRRAGTNLEHGKASTYTNWLCRCEPCVAAHSKQLAEYKRDRRARLAAPPESRVDVHTLPVQDPDLTAHEERRYGR